LTSSAARGRGYRLRAPPVAFFRHQLGGRVLDEETVFDRLRAGRFANGFGNSVNLVALNEYAHALAQLSVLPARMFTLVMSVALVMAILPVFASMAT